MRIWTIHPRYLDRQGLVALWREGLLAQAVLLGETTGYRHHPQLIRFQSQRSPVAAIATYLKTVHAESEQRSYDFALTRIHRRRMRKRIPETEGQLEYEWHHLLAKLRRRSPERYKALRSIAVPESHPLFEIVPGDVKPWEKRQQNQQVHGTAYRRP